MREYNLARQGFFEAQRDKRRLDAQWFAILLSAQTGTAITAEDLMGEGETAEEKVTAAEQQLERLLAERKAAAETGEHGG